MFTIAGDIFRASVTFVHDRCCSSSNIALYLLFYQKYYFEQNSSEKNQTKITYRSNYTRTGGAGVLWGAGGGLWVENGVAPENRHFSRGCHNETEPGEMSSIAATLVKTTT